jgi:hypothetical protein
MARRKLQQILNKISLGPLAIQIFILRDRMKFYFGRPNEIFILRDRMKLLLWGTKRIFCLEGQALFCLERPSEFFYFERPNEFLHHPDFISNILHDQQIPDVCATRSLVLHSVQLVFQSFHWLL